MCCAKKSKGDSPFETRVNVLLASKTSRDGGKMSITCRPREHQAYTSDGVQVFISSNYGSEALLPLLPISQDAPHLPQLLLLHSMLLSNAKGNRCKRPPVSNDGGTTAFV